MSGKIASGNQLQALGSSSYKGNSLLCEPPLPTKCPRDEIDPKATSNGGNDDKGIESQFFYVSMAMGFIFGFWGVCGTLIIKTSWRQAYFQSFDKLEDIIAILVMFKVVPWLKKVKLERT